MFPTIIAINVVGWTLATQIGGIFGGIFRMLDSQLEII